MPNERNNNCLQNLNIRPKFKPTKKEKKFLFNFLSLLVMLVCFCFVFIIEGK